MNWAPSSTSRRRSSSSPFSGAYCEWTSTSGIVTAVYCSCLGYPIDEIRRERDNACRDDILGIAEVVMEALVARAEAVAGARDPERPDRRPDEGQQHVRNERHLEDARRNRDERPDDGCEAADQDAEVAPAVEPALGPVEPRRRDVEPAAVPLEQRPAAAQADPPADHGPHEIAERARERHDDVGAGTEADLRAEDRY